MNKSPATPLRMAADKALNAASAKMQGKSEAEVDKELQAEKNKRLKSHVDKIINAKESVAHANADVKGAIQAAVDDGFDGPALKTIVKHKMKQISAEHKQNVNQMCLAIEMPVIYRLEATN
jgi:uncharacterized protein (UPF0335 family)